MKKIEMSQAVPRRYRPLGLLIGVAVVAVVAGASSRSAQAVLPALPNAIQQWNKIAEDTVVGSGAFQGEGEIYMSYASLAVYDAVVAISGGYEPYGPRGRRRGRCVRRLCRGRVRLPDAAPLLPRAMRERSPGSTQRHSGFLGGCSSTSGGANGRAVGLAAANSIIALHTGDGRLTPIGTTSPFETKSPGPGVWRLTPPGVLGSANAVARLGAALLAQAPRTVPATASDPTYEQGVGAGSSTRSTSYGGSTSKAVRTPDQTASRMVLHSKCDPAVQHCRS